MIRTFGLRRLIQFVTQLPSFAKLFSRLAKDPRVGLIPKLVLSGTLLYFIMPFDLIPDFLPGIGQMDDLLVIFMGAQAFLRLCPKDVVQEHVHAIARGR
jgi:uncharacterized membrane protein YkvA (DUF1232 family)